MNARPSTPRVWLAAIRPATLWAGAVPVLVGTGLAIANDVLRVGPALAALAGALLIQIGTNLVNDLADFKRGADGPDRLGPARATAKGWLTQRQVFAGAALSLAAAAGVGAWLVVVGGWPILALGIASLICAVGYTAGPMPLGYVGLGDLFVLLFFGFAAVAGTYYVQAGTVSAGSLWAGLGVGAVATGILVVNNLRDRFGDARVGKRTLAVRFGARFARLEYAALLAAAYAAVLAGVLGGTLGRGALAALLSLPLAVRTVRAVHATDGAALNPLLGATAKLELIYGLLLAVGVAVWQ